MTKDMTTGSPAKMIILFSLPIFIGNIFQQFYSMADAVIVGRFVGVEALAAVGNTGSLNFLINGFIIGITSGFSISISQKFGAKDEAGLRKSVYSALKLSLIFAIIITILSVLLVNPALKLMNTPENIIRDSETYIRIIFLGSIAVFFYNIASSILRAIGDSKTPLYFLILASILNVGLDLIFIINFDMGVAGAAYATIISQAVSAILSLLYGYFKYPILRLKKEDFKVKKSMYIKHLKMGIPMGLQFSITGVGIIIVQGALNIFGSNVIAAYTAASKALQLVMQASTSIAVTIATFCGQNMGAKNYTRIKEGLKTAALISIVTSIIAGVVLIFGSDYFVKIFIDNPTLEILEYTRECLIYAGIFFIPLGLLILYRNALQGMGESLMPMRAGVYELLARTIVVFTLPRFIGYTGICISDPVAWIAAAIPLMYSYRKKINALTTVK